MIKVSQAINRRGVSVNSDLLQIRKSFITFDIFNV